MLVVHERLACVQRQCGDWSHGGRGVSGFVCPKSYVKASVMHSGCLFRVKKKKKEQQRETRIQGGLKREVKENVQFSEITPDV